MLATLRVLTFNTASYNDGPFWCSSHDQVDDNNDPLKLGEGDSGSSPKPIFDFCADQKRYVVELIRRNDPDVVCLQESILMPDSTVDATKLQTDDDEEGTDDDGAADGEADEKCKREGRGRLRFCSLLPEYEYLGKTQTHADYCVLFVKRNFDLPTTSNSSDDRAHVRKSLVCELIRDIPEKTIADTSRSGKYNFPLCVLRLKKEDNNASSASAHHLAALTSVHFTPFTSGGGRRSGRDGPEAPTPTRREAQLRSTAAGLYRAVASAAAAGGSSSVSGASIIVAGDTNMKESETACPAALHLRDCHDVLLASPQRHRTTDGVSLLPQGAPATDATDPIWTWNTHVNRSNGHGAKYLARYDRVYSRDIMHGGASFSTSSGSSLEDFAQQAAVDAMNHLLPPDPTTDQQQEQSAPSRSAPRLEPTALRLIGHEPIIDRRLDAIESAAFLKYVRDEYRSTCKTSETETTSSRSEDIDETLLLNWAKENLEQEHEHDGPVPEGGRPRFLSDHFGMVIDFDLHT